MGLEWSSGLRPTLFIPDDPLSDARFYSVGAAIFGPNPGANSEQWFCASSKDSNSSG